MESRRSLLKKLAVGALALQSSSKRALASYFSEETKQNLERAGEADFHVSPEGQDSNPGTAGAPFGTLGRARDAVRKKVSAGLTGDVRVLIRGGIYEQT